MSTNGGTQPRWRRDGRELFYISADSKMMAAGVTTTPEFKKVSISCGVIHCARSLGRHLGNLHQRFPLRCEPGWPKVPDRRRGIGHHGPSPFTHYNCAELANTGKEMSLAAGTKLGPYEIVAPIGSQQHGRSLPSPRSAPEPKRGHQDFPSPVSASGSSVGKPTPSHP